MKMCKSCLAEKELSAFYSRKNGTVIPICKECYLSRKRQRLVERLPGKVVPEFKDCRDCGNQKPSKEFHSNYSMADGLSGICKDCAYLANLKTKYGVTNISEMLVRSEGKCEICREEFSGRPYIDHDHACCPTDYTCGKCVRGLLCRNCNNGIGLLKDSPLVLRSAAQYLER